MDMSFREKSAWACLVTTGVVFVPYFAFIFRLAGRGELIGVAVGAAGAPQAASTETAARPIAEPIKRRREIANMLPPPFSLIHIRVRPAPV